MKLTLCAAILVQTSGCASSKETALIAYFRSQRSFPEYTQNELEARWEKIVDKHRLIRVGMSIEEVVAVLGLPDTDVAKHGKTAWVRPEDGILQYSAGAVATPKNTALLKIFHVYFDTKGKVSKTVKNGGFIFTPPPR